MAIGADILSYQSATDCGSDSLSPGRLCAYQQASYPFCYESDTMEVMLAIYHPEDVTDQVRSTYCAKSGLGI